MSLGEWLQPGTSSFSLMPVNPAHIKPKKTKAVAEVKLSMLHSNFSKVTIVKQKSAEVISFY